MIHRKYIEIRDGRVINEMEYFSESAPEGVDALMDVTARNDGPFIGKLYDAETGVFTDPPPPPEEEEETQS